MKATSSADINTPVGAEERSKLICRPKYFFEVMLLADGENNDVLTTISQKGKNISKSSDKNDILVLDRSFRHSLDIVNSVGLRSELPYFGGKGTKTTLMHLG